MHKLAVNHVANSDDEPQGEDTSSPHSPAKKTPLRINMKTPVNNYKIPRIRNVDNSHDVSSENWSDEDVTDPLGGAMTQV